MDSVYLETSIPSYLTANPSRDIVTASNQQLTHQWWASAPERFELLISEVVLEEISRGDPVMVQKRQTLLDGLPVLLRTAEVRSLSELYQRKLGLADNALTDLVHIALAVVYEVDYLLTWNCKHIANGQVRRRLRKLNEERHLHTPTIVTPQELLESQPGETP